MTSTRNTFAIVCLAALLMLQTSVLAANCTSDEQTTVNNVYTDLTNSSACADLISDSGATSLAYCMNSDCVSELSDAVDQLPDCTSDDEIDRKTGLQAIVAFCSNATEVLDQSASASVSGSADADATDGSGSVVSGATSNVMTTTGAAVVALYFFAALL
ncbi:hypothetical protein PRIC1_010023 [Phytophthora ramorum]